MREVPIASISKLKRGDIIRNMGSPDSLVVTSCYGSTATAVLTVEVTNPSEWLLVEKDPDDAGSNPFCIWITSAPITLQVLRQTEARLVAYNVPHFAAGFYEGRISPHVANALFGSENSRDGDRFEVCGICFTVRNEQVGALVWGKR